MNATNIERTVSPDFDLGSLGRYLGTSDFSLNRISGGQSNPTYFLTIKERQLVLRKAPSGEILPGAHAVGREYRVIKAIASHGIPVPEVVAMESNPDVLGAPFFLMNRLDGTVCESSLLPDHSPDERQSIYAHKAEVLGHLHSLDPKIVGLEDFGRHGAFFSRQLRRWTRQWELSKTHPIPELDELCSWLAANENEDDSTCIVHGDYRIGNLMLCNDRPQIAGVLDWELATLGHPLADLAHTMSMWFITQDEYGGLMGADLRNAGIPDHRQFEEDYLTASGGAQGLTEFHYAFALFRFAVIFAGIGARAKAGTAASDDAANVGQLASVFARRAGDIISGKLGIN